MRRRLAAAAAVTSAFLLLTAAPAFAQGEEEEGPPFLVEDNPSCADLDEIFGLDFELVALFDKVENPAKSVDNQFVTATLSQDGKSLDVEAKEGVLIDAVIVKGGPDAFVYTEEPFTDMTAPPLEESGNIPEISHYEVCGVVEETPTPTPTPTTPTETPTPTQTPTVQPTASESPAMVPTAVPAGVDDGGSGSAGLKSLVLAGGVAVAGAAGAAAAVRRQTRHGA